MTMTSSSWPWRRRSSFCSPQRMILLFLVVMMTSSSVIVMLHSSIVAVEEERTKKNGDMLRSFNSLKLAADTRICLVHIGKTAGSKISCEMGERGSELKCRHDDSSPAPSALQSHYVARTHMWGEGRQCQSQGFNTFLYTLRNPLDRLVSWYYYEHPQSNNNVVAVRKCRMEWFHNWTQNPKGCFRTLIEWAEHALPPPLLPPDNRTECQRLAYSVAAAQLPCSAHNKLGYQFYTLKMQRMMQNATTVTRLAIRTEHVAEDWDALETALGGGVTGVNNGGVMTMNGTTRFQTTAGTVHKDNKKRDNNNNDVLSPLGRQNLCRALCDEIQAYKKLLLQAKNLNQLQIRQSLSEVVASCPDETLDIRDCSFLLP